MKPIAAIIYHEKETGLNPELVGALRKSPFIEKVIVVVRDRSFNEGLTVCGNFPFGGETLSEALGMVEQCRFVIIIPSSAGVDISQDEISRFLDIAENETGGLYFADYYCTSRAPHNLRQVMEYQQGSIRDDFSFGPVYFFSVSHIERALQEYGKLSKTKWAGMYELRLKVSLTGDVKRIPEPLSLDAQGVCEGGSHFDYVRADNLDYQKEMEQAATRHLKSLGAYCSHEPKPFHEDEGTYPVEASVVIPVRNRERTITDALRSALNQKAPFNFNVIVVQNHSEDGTGEKIEAIARRDGRVVYIIPERKDLGIGGCWNVAVTAPQCGRYVCQLDSDDLYEREDTLAMMVESLREQSYGMVVGTYRVVDFDLKEISPGIVDHREWTETNGRNNLLRVHGIGAPRAFPTGLLRQYPFPNVSYGEDYAVALRISRDYRVGRIFTSLYLCRRWEDNTDAVTDHRERNRLFAYKDGLRAGEITERQRLL
jgi:hypothetical protein